MDELNDMMRAIGSVRPPEADLTDQMVSPEERRALFERIVGSNEPLPTRLERIQPRSVSSTATKVVGLAAALMCIVLVAAVTRSTNSQSTERIITASTDSTGTHRASYVAAHTADAVAMTVEQQLNIAIAVVNANGFDLGRLQVAQSPTGDATKIDELDAAGVLVRSTLLTTTGDRSQQRIVDYINQKWSETSGVVPSVTSGDDERGVVFVVDGADTAVIGLGWIASPTAIQSLLDGGEMTVVSDGEETIHLSGPVAALHVVSGLGSRLSSLDPDARLDLWVDSRSYLPTRTRVMSADGSVSDASVWWTGSGDLTLTVPDGFEFD